MSEEAEAVSHKRKRPAESEEKPAIKEYVSPIAKPILSGKLFERGIKLLRKAAAAEASARENGATLKASDRYMKRGVAEVSKFLRKGGKGVVLMAGDVYPVDILAPMPVYCEELSVPYGFLGNKRTLGSALLTNRPASIVLIAKPTSEECPYKQAYDKLEPGLKEACQLV